MTKHNSHPGENKHYCCPEWVWRPCHPGERESTDRICIIRSMGGILSLRSRMTALQRGLYRLADRMTPE